MPVARARNHSEGLEGRQGVGAQRGHCCCPPLATRSGPDRPSVRGQTKRPQETCGWAAQNSHRVIPLILPLILSCNFVGSILPEAMA